MPLSFSTRRNLTGSIEHCRTRALNFAEQSVFKDLKVNTTKLYVSIFGSKQPITFSFTPTKTLEDLNLKPFWEKTWSDPLDTPQEQLFLVPISPRFHLKLPGLKNCLNLGAYFTERLGWREDNVIRLQIYRMDDANPNQYPPDYIDLCRSKLADYLTTDQFEALDRIVNLHDYLAPTKETFAAYIEQVRSLGGLYRKLPILNSLISDSSIKHVTMTRQTPDPPQDLIERLNLIASLNTARAASRQGAQS